ncbi:Box C/D snoRNA accumulation [Marasmius tenuissimus]|uniref:Box C/D snoRNA accumulation n=1 Tax=Marasmius tenuissimus TaxID=585030 RepID=A0ABR3ABT0_9AGAR
MNEYGYREMMNDYVYLEQVGRRVKDWGGEIVKGGFDQNSTDRKGKGREFMTTTMKGQRVARGKGPGKSKRELLKLKLEARDIYMELLPLGMERKKMNESSWDFKSQMAWLTIEFIFHPPNITPPLPPTTLVTHRNNISMPLLKLVESHIQKSTSKQPLPDWIHDLLPPPDSDDPDPPTPPLFLIRVSPPTTTTHTQSKRFYRPLPPNDPLLTSLRDIPFVEFPTIEVVDSDSSSTFDGIILQSDSQSTDYQNRSPKRRKITVDKAAMSGLLGGYGSSGSDGEDDRGKEKSALEGLGGYDSEEEEEDVSLNPAALEELVKLARAAGGDEEEDEVDWDDSDIE